MNPSIINELLSLFASTIDLRLTAHLVHLNVVGSTAYQNHLLTGRIYDALNGAIDEVGEHIRTLGVFAPNSIGDVLAKSASIQINNTIDPTIALPGLVTALESSRDRWNALSTLAANTGDQLTADLAAGQGRCNAKLAYLVRSIITTPQSTLASFESTKPSKGKLKFSPMSFMIVAAEENSYLMPQKPTDGGKKKKKRA